METRTHVGTRLPGASCNVLNSDWNFSPLPTDRKLGLAFGGLGTALLGGGEWGGVGHGGESSRSIGPQI